LLGSVTRRTKSTTLSRVGPAFQDGRGSPDVVAQPASKRTVTTTAACTLAWIRNFMISPRARTDAGRSSDATSSAEPSGGAPARKRPAVGSDQRPPTVMPLIFSSSDERLQSPGAWLGG
jgi:hypothetical protein